MVVARGNRTRISTPRLVVAVMEVGQVIMAERRQRLRLVMAQDTADAVGNSRPDAAVLNPEHDLLGPDASSRAVSRGLSPDRKDLPSRSSRPGHAVRSTWRGGSRSRGSSARGGSAQARRVGYLGGGPRRGHGPHDIFDDTSAQADAGARSQVLRPPSSSCRGLGPGLGTKRESSGGRVGSAGHLIVSWEVATAS